MTPEELERLFGAPLVQVVGDLVGLPRGRATLSPDEVFVMIGVGRTAGYELLKNGLIPAKKLGGKWVIPTPALLLWLLSIEGDDDAPALRGLP